MRKLLSIVVSGMISTLSFAQLSGTLTIPGTYTSIAAAISDLNAQGVNGPLTFSIVGPYVETAPTGGYTITATGTSANPITIKATGGATITAYSGGNGTPGSAVQDGVFHVVGGDYITFEGLTIYDPNTINPATMEYGIGFFKASGTDGCQNNTVTSCTIVMSYNNNAAGSGPSYDGSKGIMFINAVYGTATTNATITAASGAHSNNSIINNVIANANYGIVFNGYADTPPFNNADDNNIITGNTIINFGGATGATNPAAGIRVNNQRSILIKNNFFNNNYLGTGAYHPSTLRGVYLQGSVNPQLISVSGNTFNVISGATTSQLSVIENAIATNTTLVLNINNNLLANCGYTTAGTSGTFYGIYNTSVGTSTISINNNTITGITSSASGPVNMIYVLGTHGFIDIQNNTITNSTLTTTGTAYAIYNSNNTPNSSVLNNTITNITKTGSGGTFYGYYNFGNPSGGTTDVSNNLISGISLTGNTGFYGIYNYTALSQTLTAVSNTVSNITSGSGSTYGINCYYSSNLSNNIIQNINAGGTVYGMYHQGTYSFSSNVSNNLISNITTTLSSYGMYISASNPNSKVFSNKIVSITSTSASANVYGAYFTGSIGAFYNNIIGDLNAPNATSALAISGIYISSGNQNIYHNTVRLSATSTGANFGTAAIYASTTPNVLLQNNIFINNSTPTGTGVTVAYRRSSTTLTTYNNASNNNIFYAGTPSASNVIFTDGTNTYSTLAAYKAAVSPRDAASQTENTQFLSLVPSNANYLHVDGTVPSYAESGGLTVSSVSVDIDGDIRQGFPGYTGSGTAPDIGADEYNGMSMAGADDVGVSAYIAPATSGCYSANENVVVTLKNYGTGSQGSIPVTVWVSGAISQTLTANYTGMLTPGATTNFTVGTINMTTAGTYSLKAFTGLLGDSNNTNDTLLTTRNVAPTFTLPQQVGFTGFNGSNLPSVFPGWYEASGTTPTGTTSAWLSQTGVGTPTNVTARVNLYTTTNNEWIIGPKIVPTASTVLKFDAAVTNWNSTTVGDNMGSDDMVRVMVSTDCGLTFTPIYTISAANNLPPTLTSFLVPLGTYSNQPIIVAFYATDGPVDDLQDYDFHLDNINIYDNTSADELALINVLSPSTSSNCFGNENVSVVVNNNGINSASNFTITSILSGANTATISTTYTNTLNSYNSATVNVGSVNMSNQGTYTLTTYITYPADVNNTNDTIVKTYNNVVLPFPMLETFDAVSPLPGLPNGWVSDNGSASYDFTVRTTGTSSIQHGAGNPPTKGICANLWSLNNTSWFETPSIGALPNQPVELSFVYRIVNFSGYANPGGTATSYSNNDSLKVYVSSNCGNTWNLVGFINGANHVVSNNFALKSYCLGNTYAGQNIKVRFEAKWSTGDYWIDIDSVKVDIAPNPVIVPSTSVVACENQNLVLTASGGVTYTWNPGSVTSGTFAPNTSATGVNIYTVTAILPSGCSSSETVTVTVNPNPTVTATASSGSVCAGSNVTLTAGGASSYTWNPGGNTASSIVVTPTASVTYTVTGEQTGCFDTATLSIGVNPVPTATVVLTDATQPSCNNGSATVTVTGGNAPYTYSWSGSASTSSVATGLNGTGASGTSHTVTITDANGCSVTKTFTISCVTGIESLMNTGVVNIYPNPAKDVLNIVTNNNDTKHIRIMDVSGRVVLETITGDNDIRLNINFSNGLYVLEIRTENGVARFNIVKE